MKFLDFAVFSTLSARLIISNLFNLYVVKQTDRITKLLHCCINGDPTFINYIGWLQSTS